MDAQSAGNHILQVAVIMLAAKFVGGLCVRHLKQPSVLGELIAGMVIGPYALGGVAFFGMRPLFPVPIAGQLPVSSELHSLAVLASAVLLFLAGLETDLQKFLRYSLIGLFTGLVGAVLAFFLGAGVVVWTGYASSYLAPQALFLGTVATATSVGLTVRVLSEKRKMDTAEGATILSAAVIDDIIGLVMLAIVLSLCAKAKGGAVSMDWGHIARIALKAGVFWVGTMAIGILGARYVGGFLRVFGNTRAITTAALALAFLMAALAEKAGLALIIGSYTMGISLSQIDRAHEIQDRLTAVYDFLVPLFFCTMGMLVDFRHLGGILVFGLLFTGVSIASKVLGCGGAAYLAGFNVRGAARVGVGMMPRQEVALIVAVVGLASGGIKANVFGAVVFMTFVTTLSAPSLLSVLFNDRSGLRRKEKEPLRATERFTLEFPSNRVAQLVAQRMIDAFRQEEFFVHRRVDVGVYEMRKDRITVFLNIEDSALVFAAVPESLQYVRFIVVEEMLALKQIFEEIPAFGKTDDLGHLLLGGSGQPAGNSET